jgi:predicted RNase H-like HicB family nuclease
VGHGSETSQNSGGNMKFMRYAVVIERGPESYGAYVPDLPGVISVGETEVEVTANIREAVALHLEGLREMGRIIPEPRTLVTTIDAA